CSSQRTATVSNQYPRNMKGTIPMIYSRRQQTAPGMRWLALVLLAAFAALLPHSAFAHSQHHPVGAVYSLTNSSAGNADAAFARFSDGSLSPAGLFPTGGA